MTVHTAILKELMIAGYEGAALLAAFGRMCAIVGDGIATPVTNMNKAATIGRVDVAKVVPAPVDVTPPPDNAKALARKAIAQSMLAPSTIAVGSHLVERFNLVTGRCDPGYASIAAHLGISVRTARRSVQDLVAAGLFGRVRHGGRNHANAYQPNWPVLMERAGEGDLSRPTLSPKPANSVPQNHLRKPDSDSMIGKAQRKRVATPDRRQGHLALPITGGRAKAEEAVRAKLNRELTAHLTDAHLPHDRPAYVETMTASMRADWDGAIEAEMRREGLGLPVILAGIAGANPDRKAS